VVDEAVDGGDSHRLVGEDLTPAAEGLVGRDGDAAVFVAPGDQFEEDASRGLILGDVGEVTENDKVVFVYFNATQTDQQVQAVA